MMMQWKRLLLSAPSIALAMGVLMSSQANAAGGIVTVINDTAYQIKPWFKCPQDVPHPACPPGWQDFGGIAAGDRFGWTFGNTGDDWEFTYTIPALGQTAPAAHVPKGLKARFDPTDEEIQISIGTVSRAYSLRDQSVSPSPHDQHDHDDQ